MVYRDSTPIEPTIDYDPSKVDPRVKKYADYVRQKMMGVDVREAQARNAEIASVVATEAKDLSQLAKEVAEIIEERYREQILAHDLSPDKDPEVVDLRRGYATAGERIDDFVSKITTKLDNTSVKLTHTANALPNTVGSLDYGLKGDGTDETALFQQVIDQNVGKKIVLAPFETELLIGRITIPSDTTLIFYPKSTVLITTGLPEGQVWFDLTGATNVDILGNNTEFIMRKSEYTTGEHRHCFNMQFTTDITFDKVHAIGSGGDGYYVGQRDSSVVGFNRNIRMMECTARNNRRQGLSITTVDGFYAYRCSFSETSGTPPSYGVDFEPNSKFDLLRNIVFDDCRALSNARGFGFYLRHLDETSEPIDITLRNIYTENNGFGVSIRNIKPGTRGRIKIENWTSKDERWSSYQEVDCGIGVVKEIELHSIDANTGDVTGWEYGLGSPVYIGKTDVGANWDCGGTWFKSLRIEDTRTPKKIQYTIGLRNPFTSSLLKELVFVNPILLNDVDVSITNDTVDVGFIEDPVNLRHKNYAANTNSTYTYLPAFEINKIISNKNATSNINFRLGKPQPRHIYRFRVENDQTYLAIQSQFGHKIYGFGATENIRSNQKGALLILQGREDGTYEIIQQLGVWEKYTLNP